MTRFAALEAIGVGAAVQGKEESSGGLFTCVELEARVPRGHPLRAIRDLTNAALVEVVG